MAQMLILSSCPAIFACPAYSLLRGFRAKCFKVRGCLLCQEVAVHLFNRENSAFYLRSMATISHTISHSMYLNPRAVSILASHHSAIVDQTPRFNNSKFIENASHFWSLRWTRISKGICQILFLSGLSGWSFDSDMISLQATSVRLSIIYQGLFVIKGW